MDRILGLRPRLRQMAGIYNRKECIQLRLVLLLLKPVEKSLDRKLESWKTEVLVAVTEWLVIVSKLPSFQLYHLEDEGVSEEWFKDREIPQIIKGPPRWQGREKGSEIELIFFAK